MVAVVLLLLPRGKVVFVDSLTGARLYPIIVPGMQKAPFAPPLCLSVTIDQICHPSFGPANTSESTIVLLYQLAASMPPPSTPPVQGAP